LTTGVTGRAIAPAGASTGAGEAKELRDGGTRLKGLGVDLAVNAVHEVIAPALMEMDIQDQVGIDAAICRADGTPDKSRVGGNSTTAVSLACLWAASRQADLPLWRYLSGTDEVGLPLPEIQIFGGGAHAGRRVDIQDFLVMPVGAQSFDEALVMVANVYHAAGKLMAAAGKLAGVADEGGWWPSFDSNEEALQTLTRAIDAAGYRYDQVAISLDIAASEFGRAGAYKLGLEQQEFDSEAWLQVLLGWVNKYPILSVEDPFAEGDTAGMQAFTNAVGQRIQVVGDDYLVTQASLVAQAIQDKACNAVLLKPNQIGTITETVQAMDVARTAGWGMVVSARSGETEDTAIVHLATGWDTGQLKVGSFARSERMAKWNEGLRIEEAMGGKAVFAGKQGLPQKPA